MNEVRKWVPVLIITMMLALTVQIGSSDASADISEFTTYEGHTYGYTTHFNDPNYDYPGDTYWSAIASFSGDSVLPLLIQSSLEGYPVFRIEENAIRESNASVIIIPERVKDICAGAFSDCPNLTDVYFMGLKPEIAAGSFPGGVTFHCLQAYEASWGGTAVTVTETESASFRYMTVDGKVYVTGHVPGNPEVSIPKTIDETEVRCVMPWAFYGNEEITSVSISSVSVEERTFMYCSNLSTLTLSDDVRYIDNEAFRKCGSLGNVSLKNVEYIGFETFRDCSSFTSITIPDSVTTLGEGSFYICSSAKTIRVGKGVKDLEPRTFGYCSALEDIILPDIGSIGGSCFINDTSLKEFQMPDTVTDVGDSAFSGCRSMYMIHISSGIRSVGDSAFSGCRSLSDITLPDSLERLGSSAFRDCRSLQYAYFKGDMPEMGSDVFSGTPFSFVVKYDSTHSASWVDYSQTDKEEIKGGDSIDPLMIAAIVAAAVVLLVIIVIFKKHH